MTKKEMFLAIASVPAVAENQEMVEFLTKQVEMLDNRSVSKKPSAKQVENEKVKESIKALLAENEKMTCGEIAKALDISSQKCSALLTQLGDGPKGSKEITKTMEKKVAFFSLQ